MFVWTAGSRFLDRQNGDMSVSNILKSFSKSWNNYEDIHEVLDKFNRYCNCSTSWDVFKTSFWSISRSFKDLSKSSLRRALSSINLRNFSSFSSSTWDAFSRRVISSEKVKCYIFKPNCEQSVNFEWPDIWISLGRFKRSLSNFKHVKENLKPVLLTV